MNISPNIFQRYKDQFRAAKIGDPDGELNSLLRHASGVNGAYIDMHTSFSVDVLSALDVMVQKRLNGMPLDRIIGLTRFCDIDLLVKDNVFRPYPETEDLVDRTIQLFENSPPSRILDLGTGSGCILLSLLHKWPNASGIGVDIDQIAIAAADENARLNNLTSRAIFRLGDWGKELDEQFDLVISNPARVATENLPYLNVGMREYDPKISLDGGEDGIKFYRMLAEQFSTVAKPGALGIFQLGPKYLHDIQRVFFQRGYRKIDIQFGYRHTPFAITVANEKNPSVKTFLRTLTKLFSR